MKRLVLVFGAILIAGFAAITIWRAQRHAPDREIGTRTGLSEEEKAGIRRFWDLYRQATTLKLQGAWEEAVAVYREALVINPNHEDSLYYLGNVLFELERYQEAVMAWRRLTQVNTVSARAHLQLGAVFSCGASGAPYDLDVAERELRRALEINQEETGPILMLGEVSLLKGRRDQALSYFGTVLQANPRSVAAHYMAGYLQWQAGDQGAALDALRHAAKHSRPRQMPAAPSREGETKTGGAEPMLAAGASRKSLFTPHWMALRTWQDQGVTARQMEEEYRALDSRIRRLTGRQ